MDAVMVGVVVGELVGATVFVFVLVVVKVKEGEGVGVIVFVGSAVEVIINLVGRGVGVSRSCGIASVFGMVADIFDGFVVGVAVGLDMDDGVTVVVGAAVISCCCAPAFINWRIISANFAVCLYKIFALESLMMTYFPLDDSSASFSIISLRSDSGAILSTVPSSLFR